MSKKDSHLSKPLYGEIATLLTTARANVRSAVNTAMVQTYWQIGRLIVEEEQKGEDRADYGKALIEQLSIQLTKDFGKGFSETNIKQMRLFFHAFPIRHSLSDEFKKPDNTLTENALEIRQSLPDEFESPQLRPELSWTHYRHLLKVKDPKTRDWYMNEAAAQNWSTRALERQINSLHYERLLSSRDQDPATQEALEKTRALAPEDILKDPYVLEFLQLKPHSSYSEKDLESALINQLQSFLLELGNGFSFVARQKRLTLDGEHFFIDLVFYNYLLKCFVLIDLKLGKLTHQDIGQIDTYVRLYEEQHRAPDDNPTIGLILCTQKNEAIARYSVLSDHQQLFASKYQLILPTEEELAEELKKELKELEGRLK